jgi:hydrogenase expression/formation protein HypC
MRVVRAWPGGALVHGRSRAETIDTRLVEDGGGDAGPIEPGQWLLVFQGAARERLSAERAAEIDATLDLLEAAMAGTGGHADAAFALPSAMSAEQLQHLTGKPRA